MMDRCWRLDLLRLSLLLACSCPARAVPAQQAQKVVFGKYYQVTDQGPDNSDNSFFLYKPPANLASGKVPALVQFIGNSWVKLDNGGEYHGPFKKMTPAIGNYISNGIAFLSVPYRATDVRYFYDEAGQARSEELIHVDESGRLTLDTTGKTMADYKARMCWQELITKCIYDGVQAIDHLTANADKLGIDIHRLFFLATSAGSSVANYITYVHHQWNQARFTPVGMILGSPQYDVPVFCALDQTWKIFMDFASPDLKVSDIIDQSWCDHFVGNGMCGVGPHQDAARKTGVAEEELCNAEWHTRTVSRFCGAAWASTTVRDLHDAQKWASSDPEVGAGMEKLWYTSRNMESHVPQPFYLLVHSHDNWFIHNSIYALAYAKKADEIGINYTSYFINFPGMSPVHAGVPLDITQQEGHAPLGKYQMYYRSSLEWRGAYQKVKDTGPGTIDEHLIFVCFVLGIESCGPGVHFRRRLLV